VSEFSQLPLDCLIDGHYYVGRGRNGNVGLWDGERKVFLVIGNKFNEWRIKREPYYTDERGCFQPFLLVDDGPVREVLRNGAWNAHYAGEMDYSIDSIICSDDMGEGNFSRFGKLTGRSGGVSGDKKRG
jgi:hypothetical protein